MCVIDYITWVTVQRDFQTKIKIEQSIVQLERTDTLAQIERDDQLRAIVKRHIDQVKNVGTTTVAGIEQIQQNCEQIREGMYYDILVSKSHDTGTESRHRDRTTSNTDYKQKKRASRIEMLKKVQGVDIRITLGQLMAVNALLITSENHLNTVMEELHTFIIPDKESKNSDSRNTANILF